MTGPNLHFPQGGGDTLVWHCAEMMDLLSNTPPAFAKEKVWTPVTANPRHSQNTTKNTNTREESLPAPDAAAHETTMEGTKTPGLPPHAADYRAEDEKLVARVVSGKITELDKVRAGR